MVFISFRNSVEIHYTDVALTSSSHGIAFYGRGPYKWIKVGERAKRASQINSDY